MFDAILHTPLFQFLLFLNLASAGLVTGGAMVMLAAYTPLLADLPQRETIMIHEGMGRYIDRYQPKLAWIALVSGLTELGFSSGIWQTIFISLGIMTTFVGTTRVNFLSWTREHRERFTLVLCSQMRQ